MRLFLIATVLAASLAAPVIAEIRPDQVTFRELYKELVETNTTFSVGSCTLAAERMAARLKPPDTKRAMSGCSAYPSTPMKTGWSRH